MLEKIGNHLRVVNFSIIVASVTLLVASVDLGVNKVESELNMIENILNAIKPYQYERIGLDATMLEKFVREEVKFDSTFHPAHFATHDWDIAIKMHDSNGRYKDSLFVTPLFPQFTVFHCENCLVADDVSYSDFYNNLSPKFAPVRGDIMNWGWQQLMDFSGDPFEPTGIWKELEQAPFSIGTFRKFWNECYRMRDVYVLRRQSGPLVYRALGGRVNPPDVPIRSIGSPLRNVPPLDESCTGLSPLPISSSKTARLRSESFSAFVNFLTSNDVWAELGKKHFRRISFAFIRERTDDVEEIYSYRSLLPGDIVVSVYGYYEHTVINLQNKFFSMANIQGVKQGTFKDTFPNLDRFVDGIDYKGDIDLALLGALIKRNQTDVTVPLEIAGFKIERDEFYFWGSFVLIGMLLYYWATLTEFESRLSGLEENKNLSLELKLVPLLIIYRGRIPFILFVAASIGLPLCVSLLLFVKQVLLTGTTINLLLCCVVIACCVVVTSATLRLRKKILLIIGE